MSWFLFKRIVRAIFTVLAVTFIIFSVIRIIPGDPVRMIVTGTAPESAVEELRKELGLDKPVPTQFLDFLKKAVRGDLGESFFRSKSGAVGMSVGGSSVERIKIVTKGVKGLKQLEEEAHKRAPVTNLIIERIPLTFTLMILTLLLGLLISSILTFLSFISRRWASGIESLTVFIQSIPNFWLAIIALLIFSAKLKLFPGAGYRGFKYLILPSLVLSFILIAPLFKIMHQSMIRILNQQFMIAAEARGLSRMKLYGHVLKHFLSSIITFLGLQLGPLFGSTIIVEYLFSLPGVGLLFIYAVLQRDYPLIVGGVMFFSAVFIISNFLVDILHGWLDPRAREWA